MEYTGNRMRINRFNVISSSLISLGRLSRWIERSRSEAGRSFGLDDILRSRLLHLDVSRIPHLFSAGQTASLNLEDLLQYERVAQLPFQLSALNRPQDPLQ